MYVCVCVCACACVMGVNAVAVVWVASGNSMAFCMFPFSMLAGKVTRQCNLNLCELAHSGRKMAVGKTISPPLSI